MGSLLLLHEDQSCQRKMEAGVGLPVRGEQKRLLLDMAMLLMLNEKVLMCNGKYLKKIETHYNSQT